MTARAAAGVQPPQPAARPRLGTALPAARPATQPAAASEPGIADLLERTLAPIGVTNVLAIARRDLTGLFVSPIAWVVAGLFTFSVSIFGFVAVVLPPDQPATMEGVFLVITNFMLPILIPVVTMRALAEERSRGTLELLLTSPVRDWELAFGKWLAAFTFYVLLLATTLVYVAILRFYEPGTDLGMLSATYAGMLLLGAAATAVGVLASSLTRTKIIAFFIALVALLIIWYQGYAIGNFIAPPANLVFEYIGGFNRFQYFLLGQVALRDVVFFVTLTIGALFLTTRVLASRRWR